MNKCNLLTLNIVFVFLFFLLFIHCEAEYEHFTDNMFHSNTQIEHYSQFNYNFQS
jgi:hypothetical protein